MKFLVRIQFKQEVSFVGSLYTYKAGLRLMNQLPFPQKFPPANCYTKQLQLATTSSAFFSASGWVRGSPLPHLRSVTTRVLLYASQGLNITLVIVFVSEIRPWKSREWLGLT